MKNTVKNNENKNFTFSEVFSKAVYFVLEYTRMEASKYNF